MSKKCPGCGGENISKDLSEHYCEDCGFILDPMEKTLEQTLEHLGKDFEDGVSEDAEEESAVEVLNEKKYHHQKSIVTKTIARPEDVLDVAIYSSELGSVIDGVGPNDWDNVSESSSVQMKRLKQKQDSITSERTTYLEKVREDLEMIFPPRFAPANVYVGAVDLLWKLKQKNKIRGRGLADCFAACMYLSCQIENCGKDADEIAYITGSSKKNILRFGKEIKKEFKIATTLRKPEEYIPQFVSDLRQPHNVAKKAIEILKIAKEKKIINKNAPKVMAAGAIYLASVLENERIIQRVIAQATQVSEVSIRTAYKNLYDCISQEEKDFFEEMPQSR